MSVINECRNGDIIYNIIEGWLQKNEADPTNIVYEERKIEIGEELEFIDSYLDENYRDKPYAWQVKFRCKDGYVGSATQVGFVTEDEWNDLKGYFYQHYAKCSNENLD